ncbi:MAG: hypothetical protein MK160_10465 [Rhodobacteraceae bacterium]|nr:hypothetical protein [Paracoccaceae bacterium]
MRALFQGLAGVIYLVATAGVLWIVATAFQNGATNLPDFVIVLQEMLVTSSLNPVIMFYAFLFVVWILISAPAFLMVGLWAIHGVNRKAALQTEEIRALMREQSRTQSEVLAVLKDLRDSQVGSA